MTHEEYESKSQMKRVEILKAEEKQMSRDELLAKINDIRTNYLPETTSELAWERLADATRALRAVVELHEPLNFDETLCGNCSLAEDGIYVPYPCLTIQAIEKELN